MKTEHLLILGGLGIAGFFLLRRGQTQAASSATPQFTAFSGVAAGTKGGKNLATVGLAPTQAASIANMANPGGSAVKPPAQTMGGRDVASGLGAVAAGAGCNAIPGAGTALSPLCGMAGGYLGGKAYDYGKDAVNWVGGLF